MSANYITFVSDLVYGDLGLSELPPPPAGTKNHLHWTVDNKPSSDHPSMPSPTPSPVTGTAFLNHHLDVMLARYEAWRSKYFLAPIPPWNGQDVDPQSTVPVGPVIPPNLTAFPVGYTLTQLGGDVRIYYNNLRHFSGGDELQDEIKAPFSYRYWAFMKWVSDLRKHLLSETVLPVPVVYDRDGTILSEKEFCDFFYQVHHIWHPNTGTIPSWTTPTPFFKTSVGQHRRKKQISRAQVGAEFFSFHTDHLEVYDRWLARTGQEKVQSINTCAHDTPTNPPVPSGIDVFRDFIGFGPGYPVVNWSVTPATVDLSPVHTNYWDGDLKEFTNVGEMGQLFATDNNPFGAIAVPGTSDSGYHGIGHVVNGDLEPSVQNNYVPRFFAWHGFIEDLWARRKPQFVNFSAVQTDSSDFPAPGILTIVRNLSTSTDAVEPANGITAINPTTGTGTVRVKIKVKHDPFDRPVELRLKCEVLRQALSSSPVITLPERNFIITTAAPINPNERQQNLDFTEEFVFDGAAGTIDADGAGPFIKDNLLFSPTPVGFKNSLVRITGYLTCKHKATDGSLFAVNGTISTTGTTATGAGTLFQAQFRQGDLIRAGGQVKMIALINSNTSITLLDPFDTNLPAGTTYERLDGFDHEQLIEIPLIQEKQGPAITAYFDHSSFSKDEVDATTVSGESVFDDAFYIILQDRTVRPAPIPWPAEVEPKLFGLLAPPIHAAGLFVTASQALSVELRDALTNAVITNPAVEIENGIAEDSTLHQSVTQRMTYTCSLRFTGNAVFAGMMAGDTKELKVVITATDRSGNRIIDESNRIRLQVNPNPYMIDGPTSWLSVDARVFKIQQGQAKFGVPAGWTNANTFIQQVIDNLRAGNGTAGGDSFDALPTAQDASVLEYSETVNGIDIFNFALSKVRLASQSGANGVRVSFRLFRWGVANVEFNNTLAYRSAASGVALLGKTTTNELASIPFFAEPRVSLTTDMNTQTDPKNSFNFGVTGVSGALSFFGAYLDINKSALRFPNTYLSDGGFSGVPPAQMRSVRDLMVGQHQCMVAEIMFSGDPTPVNATPGSSDNLAQRNLLIVQSANPGDEVTRTVQHSFNIDLTRKRYSQKKHNDHDHKNGDDHGDDNGHNGGHHMTTPEHGVHDHSDHGKNGHEEECCDLLIPQPATPLFQSNNHDHSDHDKIQHLKEGWLGQFPEVLEKRIAKMAQDEHEALNWKIDPENWKRTDRLDELVFFWKNLPENSIVDIYLPGIAVQEVFNYRSLRHAPKTVRIVNSNTLRLVISGGVTYLPIPPFWGDNLSGLVTVKLPVGIKKGERYKIDVLQMRGNEAKMLGGFQLNIQVEKAFEIIENDMRWLELFHKRVSLAGEKSRWYPILTKQLEFFRGRAKSLVDLANEETPDKGPFLWNDPTEFQQGQKVKIILEKIQVLNDLDPWLKGKGEFQFHTLVYTRNNNGIIKKQKFPPSGHIKISDKAGENIINMDSVIFDDFAKDHLILKIGGVELDTFDPDDPLTPYQREFIGAPKDWLGTYSPDSSEFSLEDLKVWKIWYRVEYSG